ncbi:MAG: hypothetical protein A3I06_16490 [Candidatus Lindowbacteria bacterium RIFCSPLOWO2_02_FULL_62_12]|nr:MAG: hypothetical protein A3I06_16490 [Candidatus Lindowbacteria bacterium RIFCSPLOWO2_02_FULL_62_12]
MEPKTWGVSVIVALLMNILGLGAGLEPPRYEMSLEGQWKLSAGDNYEWKSPEFNDESWKNAQVPAAWESQGLTDYNGYGWYRYTFVVPKEWEKTARGFILDAGQIDDEDITFVNGHDVGSSSGWDVSRSYGVPKSLIKFGEKNVIAIRVYDRTGGGGIHKGPVKLRSGVVGRFDVEGY